MNRQTSTYTLHAHIPLGAHPAQEVARIRDLLGPDMVTDQHIGGPTRRDIGISYRATDDQTAAQHAQTPTSLHPGWFWSLTTGYGIHRRTIQLPGLTA